MADGHRISSVGGVNADVRNFFEAAPLDDDRREIIGVVCGVRLEAVEEPQMQKAGNADQPIDELLEHSSIDRILRVTS